MPSTSPPAPVPRSPSTVAQPAAPKAAPPAWEARLAALETRLSGVQALCDSLRDVPRMLASIQQKLDLQLGATSPPSLPAFSAPGPATAVSERSRADAAASLPSASLATAAFAPVANELSQRMDAQDSLLDRLVGQIAQLAHTFQDVARLAGGLPQTAAVIPAARQ